NAGAITTTSLLPGSGAAEKLVGMLDILEDILDKRLAVNEDVFLSEWKTASLNRALAYYLEEKGFLSSSVEETLEAYCKQCAIELTSEDLAVIGL
ncbi:glutaminase, partial [Acinetobacter baumannii]|uniref:glutaminase n=1 Tax=Acinetobacter baumannii TaxID=470 RepID=UPI000A74110E